MLKTNLAALCARRVTATTEMNRVLEIFAGPCAVFGAESAADPGVDLLIDGALRRVAAGEDRFEVARIGDGGPMMPLTAGLPVLETDADLSRRDLGGIATTISTMERVELG